MSDHKATKDKKTNKNKDHGNRRTIFPSEKKLELQPDKLAFVKEIVGLSEDNFCFDTIIPQAAPSTGGEVMVERAAWLGNRLYRIWIWGKLAGCTVKPQKTFSTPEEAATWQKAHGGCPLVEEVDDG